MSNYLTVRDISKILKVHEVTVRTLIKSKQLPAIKTGLKWLVDETALKGYINKHERAVNDY